MVVMRGEPRGTAPRFARTRTATFGGTRRVRVDKGRSWGYRGVVVVASHHLIIDAMAWAETRLAGEEERQTKDGQEEPKAFGDNSGGERCRYKETGHARPAVSMQPQFTQRVAERETWGN